jgi:hypothetical protein
MPGHSVHHHHLAAQSPPREREREASATLLLAGETGQEEMGKQQLGVPVCMVFLMALLVVSAMHAVPAEAGKYVFNRFMFNHPRIMLDGLCVSIVSAQYIYAYAVVNPIET